MALSMKNFNILEVHWKIQLLDGRFMKNQYRGGNSLKRGTWIVSWFKGWGLGKKEGRGVFEGWLIIQCTLWFCCDIGYIYIYIKKLLSHSDQSFQVHNTLLQLWHLAEPVWNFKSKFYRYSPDKTNWKETLVRC